MKRTYLLTLLSILILTFSNCEKQHHDDCENENNNNCMHSVDYWRTHPAEWDVNGLVLAEGHSYSKEQLLVILFTPANGNELISLAQELIALKLNQANGVSCQDISDAIVAGEDRIAIESEDDELLPPFGDAYSNSDDTKDLADDLRAMNEGELPTSCCTEAKS